MAGGPTYPYPETTEGLLDWGQKLIVVLKRAASQSFPFTRNPVFLLAEIPPANSPGAKGATIFISDESGGATLAFSDGVHWRRVSDRAVVS